MAGGAALGGFLLEPFQYLGHIGESYLCMVLGVVRVGHRCTTLRDLTLAIWWNVPVVVVQRVHRLIVYLDGNSSPQFFIS